MQKVKVQLESEPSKSFFATCAANSLDIDIEKKSTHTLEVDIDIETPYNIGLILGASGSGKTTLAKQIFGQDCFKTYFDKSQALIDQFPKEMSYDDRCAILNGIGLSSVPCWIRPGFTLSNGQLSRAEAALAISGRHNVPGNISVFDEWTSVVDRTVAKAMSHCVQKMARKKNSSIVLLSCHYDVGEWLDPDWIIDCNTQNFIDRRSLCSEARQRRSTLQFQVREIGRSSWTYFSKYHYLSDSVPPGKVYFYGLFDGENQIGFMCFANYVPIRQGSIPSYHSNRVVIHPDYVGFGLGLQFVNVCCRQFIRKMGNVRLYATFSSLPMLRARLKDSTNWKMINSEVRQGRYKKIPPKGSKMHRQTAFRQNLKIYTFHYVGST